MSRGNAKPRKGKLGDRYFLCPASRYLHPPMAVLVSHTVNMGKPKLNCACGTNVWVSPQVDSQLHGYTLEQVQTVPGLLTVQRTLKSFLPDESKRRHDYTGKLYVPCPFSTPIQADQPQQGEPVFGLHYPAAIPVDIKNGKRNRGCYTAFCPLCRSRMFMGDRWVPTMGLTPDEAFELGLGIVG